MPEELSLEEFRRRQRGELSLEDFRRLQGAKITDIPTGRLAQMGEEYKLAQERDPKVLLARMMEQQRREAEEKTAAQKGALVERGQEALGAVAKVGAALDVPHRALLRTPGALIGQAIGGGGLSLGEAWRETAEGLPGAIEQIAGKRWAEEHPVAMPALKWGAGLGLEIAGDIGLGWGIGGAAKRVGGETVTRYGPKFRKFLLPKKVRRIIGAVEEPGKLGRATLPVPGTELIGAVGQWLKKTRVGKRAATAFARPGRAGAPVISAPVEEAVEKGAKVTYGALGVEEDLANWTKLGLSEAGKTRSLMAAEILDLVRKGQPDAIEQMKRLGLTYEELDGAILSRRVMDGIEQARRAADVPTPTLKTTVLAKAEAVTKELGERKELLGKRVTGRMQEAIAQFRRETKRTEALVTRRSAKAVAAASPIQKRIDKMEKLAGELELDVAKYGKLARKQPLQLEAPKYPSPIAAAEAGPPVKVAAPPLVHEPTKVGVPMPAIEQAAPVPALGVSVGEMRPGRMGAVSPTPQRAAPALEAFATETPTVHVPAKLAKTTEMPPAMARNLAFSSQRQANRLRDTASKLRRAVDDIEQGRAAVRIHKPTLKVALGKEEYAQSLHRFKETVVLRGQQERAEKLADAAWKALDDPEAWSRAITEDSKFAKLVARSLELDEAVETSISYVPRVSKGDIAEAMREIRSSPVIALRRAYSWSGGMKLRHYVDPSTGKAYSAIELQKQLTKAMKDPAFAASRPDLLNLVEAYKSRGEWQRAKDWITETLQAEPTPLYGKIFETDIEKLANIAGARALQDGMRTGFVNGLKQVGREVTDRGEALRLIGSGDWIRASEMPEDVAKAFSKDWLFPREARREMNRILGVARYLGPTAPLARSFDKALSWWRWSVTGPFPAFHFRNNYSDFIQMACNGEFNPEVVIREGLKAVWKKGKINMGTLGNLPADEVLRLARSYNVPYGLMSEIGRGSGTMRDITSKIGNFLGTGGISEDVRRVGYWVDRVQHGFSPRQASIEVLKALGDYRNYSPLEKSVLRRVFPFWGWLRHNIPFQVRTLITKPYMTAAQLRIRRIGGKQEAPEWVPDWMRKMITLTFSDKGTVSVVHGIGFPVSDLIEMFDSIGDPKEGLRNLAWNAGPFGTAISEARGFTTDYVRAPKATETLPPRVRDALKMRQEQTRAGPRWMMPGYSRLMLRMLRVLAEPIKVMRADTPAEGLLRAITGIGIVRYTDEEIERMKEGEAQEELERKEELPIGEFRKRYLLPSAKRTEAGKEWRQREKRMRRLGKKTARQKRGKEEERARAWGRED
jgi:hypothetical protein